MIATESIYHHCKTKERDPVTRESRNNFAGELYISQFQNYRGHTKIKTMQINSNHEREQLQLVEY